ncbi:putative UDP-galactose translocator [Opisthorchis viverrini]|uniref:Putative UDP-galactose translocator n=1 Tax=Opisthorchis viverrini TaxID=6198 RepID=A0A1S8WG12_OPIVI|nr:putative UDP-galactose translocator [Opisthorchis viverrini]
MPRLSIGHVCLLVLVFQNLLYTLCMRYGRSRNAPMFIISSMMVTSEAVKLLTCLVVLHSTGTLKHSYAQFLCNIWDSIKSCLPALIYLVQNRLLVAALGNLDAATFQVAYQLKLLTTALFSVLILRKPISLIQWFSLLLLFFGVAIVEPPSGSKENPMSVSQNPSLGLFYVVCASLLSGFACVYLELLFKNPHKSLWLRNIEVAGTSLVTGAIVQWISDGDLIKEKGYFYGFDWLVWILVGLHSFGGLIVAMVVKYANNMLKGFACSMSIVLSCIYSVLFLGVHLSPSFLIGACLVLISVVLYAAYPPRISCSPTVNASNE